MYMHVCVCMCMYVYVSVAIACWGTETTTVSPKHPLATPHQGGPTQGTPGHVPDHFLTPSQPPPPTRFFDFSFKNRCWDLSCHGRRIGQEHPGRLKLGLLVVLAALYKVRQSLLKSDIYFWFSGAPKMTQRPVFNHCAYGGVGVECTTN